MTTLGVIIFGNVVILAYLWASIGGVKAHLDDSLAELDGKLAQAIQQVLDAGAQINMEPPNPMQQMVMALIQERMTALPRGEDGRFEKGPPLL